MAGAIAGVLLAVLLHVTVGLAAIAATYLAVERLARWSGAAAWALAAVVVGGSLVTFALVSLG
jgi:succinate dehydrogenase hydrophobic anchor subunit